VTVAGHRSTVATLRKLADSDSREGAVAAAQKRADKERAAFVSPASHTTPHPPSVAGRRCRHRRGIRGRAHAAIERSRVDAVRSGGVVDSRKH